MIKQHLTWTQIEDLAIRLADRLPTSYDVMLVITRGGMVPACIVSERLNLRNIMVAAVMFYTEQEHTLDKPIFLQFPADPLLNGKQVLIVDLTADPDARIEDGASMPGWRKAHLNAGPEAERDLVDDPRRIVRPHYAPKRQNHREG